MKLEEYLTNYEHLTLAEKELFYHQYPKGFKERSAHVHNIYHSLQNRAHPKFYTDLQKVKDAVLTDSQMHDLIDAVPELYFHYKDVRIILTDFENLSPEQIIAYEKTHPTSIQKALTQSSNKKAQLALDSGVLHSDILTLSGDTLDRYLSLVIASGLQVAEYLDKYNWQFINIYKSSKQHPNTQKIVLAKYPQFIFHSQMTNEEKIDFIGADLHLFLDSPPFDLEVECFHKLKDKFFQMSQEAGYQEYIIDCFFKKTNLLDIIHKSYPDELATFLNLRVYFDTNLSCNLYCNIAQKLYSHNNYTSSIGNLLKDKYLTLLLQKIDSVSITQDFSESIDFSKCLLTRKLDLQILNLGLSTVPTNIFATAVLRQDAIDKTELSAEHIEYLLTLPRVQDSNEMMIYLEKKLLEHLQIKADKSTPLKI